MSAAAAGPCSSIPYLGGPEKWTESAADTLRALEPRLELHPFLPILALKPCESVDQALEALLRLQELLACLHLSSAGCEVLTYLT